jgi:tRNA-specific 2-thiouridylase
VTKAAKVVVAMSGGVDSSVAAALLKDQGFEVIGMMLRLWSEPGKEGSNRCCTPESMGLARRAAAILDIPFYVLDAKEAFRHAVVEPFMDGYGRGLTPNPCLECNRTIRWTLLLEHALALGAERMATGHYARTETDNAGVVQLRRAVDDTKDQSYVLHVLNQSQLTRAEFPLGEYTKTQVRRFAEEHGLPMASRHDSQDLCFLAGGDYRDFLRRNGPELMRPGNMINSRGVVVGRHNGLAEYTIGQRKGLRLPSPVPMYVLRKDIGANALVVGTEGELGIDRLMAGEVNWIAGRPMPAAFTAQVKTRYTAKAQAAEVTPIENGSRVLVYFEQKQRDITPGQAVVFYIDDAVVGGGIIE